MRRPHRPFLAVALCLAACSRGAGRGSPANGGDTAQPSASTGTPATSGSTAASDGATRRQAPYPAVDASTCGAWALTDNVCCARYCAQ